MTNDIKHSLQTILALDLGTTLGWAIRYPTGRITFDTITFKLKRFEGGGMPYLRFKQFTGKGNASKQEVIKAVKRKGFTTEDHNEADSLALLDLILSKYNEEEL
ncbi:hypothetical protein [Candidatus Tisiphia endosymbiont of Thecophora atra]|uniref:hypothetical protein n=1 Tax=Candidatus Tisiphia endosymbiont of Thecophora atra TaxID=3066258 RepID=UPI00312C9497